MTTIILAIGDSTWGKLALNLALSIKANDDKQPILLIYEQSAMEDLLTHYGRYFDHTLKLDTNDSGHGTAFELKTRLYELATTALPNETRFLLIDADCILLPSKTIKGVTDELKGSVFQTWCNGYYDFEEKKDYSNGYTYWFDVENQGYSEGYLPQSNTSFIYFEKYGDAKDIFKDANRRYKNPNKLVKRYKGVIPDEYCFNFAQRDSFFVPRKLTYHPIFFQFANEYQNAIHVQHHYPLMGFAGEHRPSNWFIHLYNEYANYYREYFGIPSWTYSKRIVDKGEIKLNKKFAYIAKAGELPNSDGGVFNPDGIILPNGDLSVVLRKEKNLDAYTKKYTHSTAIAHFIKNGKHEEKIFVDRIRTEDFRFSDAKYGYNSISYTCVEKDRTYIAKGGVEVILPIIPNKIEKNWMFYRGFCIYSLSPYKLYFYSTDTKRWQHIHTKQYDFDWFHKGHQICNSTNPINIVQYLLMFFHSKENGVYFQGAVLLHPLTMEIMYATKNSIHIMDNPKGLHDGLVYVSGSVYLKDSNTVRVYFGEADWNACQVDFDKDELVNAIKNNSK